VSTKTFVGAIQATNRDEAIRELCRAAAEVLPISVEHVSDAIIEHEAQSSTALGEGVAVPHARLDGFPSTVCIFGLSARGIDFDSDDGKPARIIFILLTPICDDSIQLELLSDIASLCYHNSVRDQLMTVPSYTEFRATLLAAAHEVH